MIKVLEIISDANIGGAGRHLLNYLKYRDRENFDISVVIPTGSMLKKFIQELGVKFYEVDGIGDKSVDLGSISKLKKVIREADPDIVHTHGSMSGRIAGRQCGKKVIYTRHTAFPPKLQEYTGLKRLIYKKINEHYADRIIAVGDACKDGLIKCGVSENIIDVMLNGVEPIKRIDDEHKMILKLQYNIQDEFVAGILARLEPYKGHMYVLDAAKILKEQGRKIKILVAGSGTCESELKKRAKELNVEDMVVFLGFVSDVPAFLSVLDVQLNASYIEAASLSLIEGFSIGVPAIVSDYSGNLLLVKNEENGLVFKMRDGEELAGCIMRYMDEPELKERTGKKAFEVYCKRFTGAIFAKNLEDIYVKTMKGE